MIVRQALYRQSLAVLVIVGKVIRTLKTTGREISAEMFALTRLIFCEPPRSTHPSTGPRINDVPHVRWSSDRSRLAIDGLDLGQDDAESARRALSRGHGFSAAGRQAGRQDGRDCRSEIEVVPLAVNLWNAATGRAIQSIIRFELRPSNCVRVIRADRLLLLFWYIPSGAANYSRLAARLW